MILSGHQPVYLPGIIVMAKIALSDKFMFVGHCDYQPRSWHSHNFIRGYQTPIKLSVPVWKGPTINETRPVSDSRWRLKHCASIELQYKNRPFFNDFYPEIMNCIMRPADSLSELNIGLMRVLMHQLEIETPTYCSQDFNIHGYKTAMLADMCQKMEATDYLSSPGETYVKPEEMNGYAHHFLKFTHPVYEQGYRDFMSGLSVIDLLFNCGPQSGRIVRQAGNL